LTQHVGYKHTHIENSEEILTNIERFLKDSGCEKCLDLETQLQEALRELSSAQLITKWIRNEYKLSMSIEEDSYRSYHITGKIRWGRK